MYVSGSVHKWGCACLCAGVRLRALAPVCVRLRVCYLYRESPLSLCTLSSAELGWASKTNPMVGFFAKKIKKIRWNSFGWAFFKLNGEKRKRNALGGNKDSIINVLDCLVQLLFFSPSCNCWSLCVGFFLFFFLFLFCFTPTPLILHFVEKSGFKCHFPYIDMGDVCPPVKLGFRIFFHPPAFIHEMQSLDVWYKL